MLTAITREVPDSLPQCELTHIARTPIDIERARAQHAEYERVLEQLGCSILRLPDTHDLPDSVFVEDTAVVCDDVAVITRPGATSRRAETPSVRAALSSFRPIREIQAPGTLDGGDVLQVSKRIFVGISTRTNEDGFHQLKEILNALGYDVKAVRVNALLHLKSAVTAIADDLLIVNPEAVDPAVFGIAYVEAREANVLAVNGVVLCPASSPETEQVIAARGFKTLAVDNSELAKAEAGLTCCSIVL